jgi:hypothetical protein
MWRLTESATDSSPNSALRDVHDLVRVATARLQETGAGTPPAPADESGGLALATFVDGQVATERDRRSQLNGRGTGLITSASGLATLLFAASALVTAPTGYQPPRLAVWALAPTLIAFVGAALCGIVAAQSTFYYDVVKPEQLEKWRKRDDIWKNSQENVMRLLVRANITTLQSLRAANNKKMRWVRIGFWTQIGALGTLAVVVFAILVAAIFPHAVGWFGMLKPV